MAAGMPSEFVFRTALRALARGEVIAHPTEAVYGLAAAWDCPTAALRILELKQRPLSKGFIVIARAWEDVAHWVHLPTQLPADELDGQEPHAISWLLPARSVTPDYLTGGSGRLAVRITRHVLSRALVGVAGPLVSTSANPHGRPPARSALAVRRYFGDRLPLVVSAPLGQARRPSRIVDLASGAVVRP